MINLPGSALKYLPTDREDAFARFTAVLDATNGITLSQIQDITDIPGTTIQNWIKRGWVINPVDKRYHEAQLARILLINMVRDVLPLESIAEMMSVVNGSVYDRDDDMLPDKEWYNLLCKCIISFEERCGECITVGRDKLLHLCIGDVIRENGSVFDDDYRVLARVLYVMVNAYEASVMKQCAVKEWNLLLFEEEESNV